MSQILLAAYGPVEFDPSSIAGLILWLRSSDLVLSNNDPVSTWADQSGTANDATQGSGTKQPLYKTNVQNGRPAVRFDGSNDILQLANSLPETASVFVAVATKSTPADQDTLMSNNTVVDGSEGGIIFWLDTNSSTNWGSIDLTFTTLNSGENLVTDQFNILEFLVSSSTPLLKLYRNGTLKASSGSQGYGGPPGFSALGGQSNDANFANVDIGEVLIYDTVLSDSNRGLVESYLSARWL